jgi:hypothetical protein
MEIEGRASILGHFVVQGADHAGALTLDGPNTKLEIFSDDFLHLRNGLRARRLQGRREHLCHQLRCSRDVRERKL